MYWVRSKPGHMGRQARDDEAAVRLWDESEQLLGSAGFAVAEPRPRPDSAGGRQASRVIIRQAPMAVQNTIQPTITSDAAKVDSGISVAARRHRRRPGRRR